MGLGWLHGNLYFLFFVGELMSAFTKCGAECITCDCGRTENKCKYSASKQRGRRVALGIIEQPKRKKKRSKRK